MESTVEPRPRARSAKNIMDFPRDLREITVRNRKLSDVKPTWHQKCSVLIRGLPYRTTAEMSDYLTPSPHMVTFTQLPLLSSTFWVPPKSADVLIEAPKALPSLHVYFKPLYRIRYIQTQRERERERETEKREGRGGEAYPDSFKRRISNLALLSRMKGQTDEDASEQEGEGGGGGGERRRQ